MGIQNRELVCRMKLKFIYQVGKGFRCMFHFEYYELEIWNNFYDNVTVKTATIHCLCIVWCIALSLKDSATTMTKV